MDELTRLLCSPEVLSDFPPELLYRSACIGALAQLRAAGNWAALAETAKFAAAPEMGTLALNELRNACRSGNTEAIRTFFTLALTDDFAPAKAILRKDDFSHPEAGYNSAGYLLLGNRKHLQRIDPTLTHLTDFFLDSDERMKSRLIEAGSAAFPHWALCAAFWKDPSVENKKAILSAYSGFTADERHLLQQTILSRFREEAPLLADLFLCCDDPDLKLICVEQSTTPSDERKKALFFFLSEQWQRYEEWDSDYRKIRSCYERNDPVLQRRLVEISRKAGHSSWLQRVDSAVLGGQRSSFSLSDWDLLIDTLTERHETGRLWDLLPTAPLLCTEHIVRSLRNAGFTPVSSEDREFFETVRNCLQNLESTPFPLEGKYFKGSTGMISATLGGSYAAAAFQNHDIRFLNRKEFSAPVDSIRAESLNVRRIILGPDGHYLAADCSTKISIFELPSGKIIKELPQAEPLCGMFIRGDGRHLITLSNRGKAAVYGFPNGVLLKSFESGLPDCFRSSFDPQNERLVAISSTGDIIGLDCSSGRVFSLIPYGKNVAAVSGTFSGDLISVMDGQGNFSSINLASGKMLHQDISTGITGRASRICDLIPGEIAVIGSLDGDVRVLSLRDGICLNRLKNAAGKSAIIGIEFRSEENRLHIASDNGDFGCYDTEFFRWMSSAMSLTELPGLSRTDRFVKEHSGADVRAAAELLKTMINRRKRFDIEVDFE